MSQRNYLTTAEIQRLLDSAKQGLNPERNRCMVAMCYLHGFRISELLKLRLSDIDLSTRTLNIRRLKNGFSTIHPMIPCEVTLLELWLEARQNWASGDDDSLFISRNGKPLSRQQGYNIINILGKRAGLPLCSHPHMLRHACGFAMADNGIDTRLIQDYLGHRNIRHTVRYTASNAARFEGIWKEENMRRNKPLVLS